MERRDAIEAILRVTGSKADEIALLDLERGLSISNEASPRAFTADFSMVDPHRIMSTCLLVRRPARALAICTGYAGQYQHIPLSETSGSRRQGAAWTS